MKSKAKKYLANSSKTGICWANITDDLTKSPNNKIEREPSLETTRMGVDDETTTASELNFFFLMPLNC